TAPIMGGALGFFAGGPIGAVAGYAAGKYMEDITEVKGIPPPKTTSLPGSGIDTAAKEAAASEVSRIKKKRGYKSTIMTGPGGLEGEAPVLKTTLG
ncbi:hypothetical protein KKF61_08945, partial [Patescibacteria group bacterium]|nr:hypothetical protein [Patescibacteria group bacterium]